MSQIVPSTILCKFITLTTPTLTMSSQAFILFPDPNQACHCLQYSTTSNEKPGMGGPGNDSIASTLYRIAENFLANFVVLWLCAKVFSTKLGAWHSLAPNKRAIHKSFLCENHIFHQSAKVFSLESFPLYGSF